MATNKKITELTELVGADLANDDVLAIVDISAGTTHKIKKSTFTLAVSGVTTLTATTPLAVDAATGDVTVSTGTIPVTKGGTGATTATAGFNALSPMTAEGDIVYGGTSGTVTKLAKGSNDEILTLASGIPSWAAANPGAGYFLGNSSGATGDTTNGLTDIFRVNNPTLATYVTIAASTNASATGPLAVNSGITLIVAGTLAII